jgi:hypothetical protein
MKFDVHLFPIVRVKRVGIEAPDEEAAIKKAESEMDLNTFFNALNGYIRSYFGSHDPVHLEYAEEMSHYLVDPVPALAPGDLEGVWFGPGYERGDPNPDGRKAALFDKLMACGKVLPMLLGIDSELDKEIAGRLHEEGQGDTGSGS